MYTSKRTRGLLGYSNVEGLENNENEEAGGSGLYNMADDLAAEAYKQTGMDNTEGEAAAPLPTGVSPSEIPPGSDDLYILKSEVVPPVCPACPQSSECPREKKCPPCPACERCPEPAFDCKKVPNYARNQNRINEANGLGRGMSEMGGGLPQPILSDFSTFGM